MKAVPLRVLIVDDEPQGRDFLELLLRESFPDIEITGKATNAEQAYSLIRLQHPDVVFLDIEMPGGSGFSLLEKFTDQPFKVIFTTAHDEYALKAIRFSALDYLMKPIDVDELSQSVMKAMHTIAHEDHVQWKLLQQHFSGGVFQKLALPVQEGFQVVSLDEIEYMEASSNYTILFLTDNLKLVVSRTLKEFEELLTKEGFCRIHHSYIVNIKHLRKYVKSNGTVITKRGKELHVSVRKKDLLMDFLKRI